MDGALRTSQRSLRPRTRGDSGAALGLARQLLRADRHLEARQLLAERVALGEIDTEVLAALIEAAERSGVVHGANDSRPKTHVDVLPAARGRTSSDVQVIPGVALAGPDALSAAEALRRQLPAATEGKTYRFQGEGHTLFKLELLSPWQLAPGYVTHRIRVFTLPLGHESEKLRRRLLHSTSALALTGADDSGLGRLSSEFRRVHACSPTAFPLLVPHQAALAGFEGSSTSDVLSVEGLALLLLQIGRGARGYLRPRRR